MISSELDALGRVGEGLRQTIAHDRMSPSWLFEGADAEAARRMALAFAAHLLAADAQGAQRERIERQVAEETHPDLHVQGKDKATVISVAALSALLHEAYGTPVTGRYQVFVIEPAEAMEPEGIARYLKALEEPPDGTVFLLVTARPDRLPQTVLSRVRRVRIPPLSHEVLVQRLAEEGIEAVEARALARCASGSLTRAKRLAEAGTHEAAHGVFRSASLAGSSAAESTERTLAGLQREATRLAQEAPEAGPDRKREYVRLLLADLLHVLSVEARDHAAGRPCALPPGVDPERALDLLRALGALSAAVSQNVTPAVILLEAYREVRQVVRPSA